MESQYATPFLCFTCASFQIVLFNVFIVFFNKTNSFCYDIINAVLCVIALSPYYGEDIK